MGIKNQVVKRKQAIGKVYSGLAMVRKVNL